MIYLLAWFTGALCYAVSASSCFAKTNRAPFSSASKHRVNLQNFPDPPVALPPLASVPDRRFDAIMEAVAANGSVAFVVEDKPLQPTLNEKEAGDLQKELLAASPNGITVPLSLVVEKVAHAFDYQAVRYDPATYLFYKRYTNPQDFPFVPFEEILRSYQSMQRILVSLDAAIPLGSDIADAKELLSSFDADRKQQISGGGIPVSSLNNQQRKWAWHYAVSRATDQSTAAILRNVSYLQAIRNPLSLFRRINFCDTGLMVLAFEGPYGPHGEIWEHGLSHGFMVQNGGLSVTRATTGQGIMTGKISGPFPDPKFAAQVQRIADNLPDRDPPTTADYVPTGMASTHTKTLTVLAQQMNVDRNAPSVPVTVDEILAPKPVTFFGEKRLNNETLLQAIALIYGLRVQHREKDLYLTTNQVKRVQSMAEVPAAIGLLFPEPLRRALQGNADQITEDLLAAETKKLPAVNRNVKGEEAVRKMYEARIRRFDVPKQRQEVLYRAAVHRLRVLIEPKINTSPDKRYLMRDMTDEEKRLFALICVLPSLNDVNLLGSARLPRSVLDFNNAILTGRVDSPTPGVHFLSMAYRDENGSLHGEGGINITVGGQSAASAVPTSPKP